LEYFVIDGEGNGDIAIEGPVKCSFVRHRFEEISSPAKVQVRATKEGEVAA
jgi:hypothetical protein